MNKSRLEAFSDGVIAILITIMVLELKVPHGADWAALRPVAPVFGAYVLSFIYIGIYWNNHHHMFQLVRRVSGAILWANLHLLFWLSLISFVTAWAAETGFASLPVALYGVVLFGAGAAYSILARQLMALQGAASPLRRAFGKAGKEKLSMCLYPLATGLAWWKPVASCALYVLVALMWLVPDPRVERIVSQSDAQNAAPSEQSGA